jgi:hypothetical protein
VGSELDNVQWYLNILQMFVVQIITQTELVFHILQLINGPEDRQTDDISLQHLVQQKYTIFRTVLKIQDNS